MVQLVSFQLACGPYRHNRLRLVQISQHNKTLEQVTFKVILLKIATAPETVTAPPRQLDLLTVTNIIVGGIPPQKN